MNNKKIFGFILAAILLAPSLVLAAMSSTNYYIYADSIDFGGGVATSTNYNLQDSLGGVAVGISTSTSYEILGGFQQAETGSLSLSLSNNNLNLGSLAAAGTVVSDSLMATIGTDSVTGYTLSVSSVGGTALSAVVDGTVDGVGGVEEYGLAVSGIHAAFLNDVAIVNGLVLSSASSSVSTATTTLTFKAVRSSGSVAATYSQNLTVTVATNI